MKTEIINDWKETITDLIDDVIKYDFEDSTEAQILVTDRDEFEERLNELIWETIDGCQEVIYTYRAQETVKQINIYDIFDEWDLTGEKFNNWSQCAFANIYDLIYNEININELITKHFVNKWLNN